MPSGPVLSQEDKNRLRKKLRDDCEQHWITSGYKKTSIKVLCDNNNISIGTFYKLYPTKEDLFFETIDHVQNTLSDRFLATCKSNPSKEGFAKALSNLLREYDHKILLYNINSPDFQSFLSKLPDEMVSKLEFTSIEFFGEAIQSANLKLKIDEKKAYGVFSALLSTLYTKDLLTITCDYFDVFDFMVNNLIGEIFE
ncbi:TetR/AcrR family transcriptional regulator [Breznakia pachnodae]|uniref:AcrR family transcriptional regulator n=1 Tax=Breznakia pachnodae TaxID=265178 RepID=A0ABU0DYN2_9FIRM|nr:TetR/AcrR family transcriptional regulator [Breznakia pachnodae]MDQ0359740.1 AcrR family transcriptional regulator [Breznakia pachnodae]